MATRTINAYACAGKGEAIQPWQYEARPLGELDVEIKISHCGICGSDLHTLDSGWGPTKYPCVVGHEIVGDRVGVGAQAWACMNRDADKPCHECATGDDSYCPRLLGTYNGTYPDGRISYGGYAEYVRLLGDFAFQIPDNIPSDQAAPLLCAGATVYTPLLEAGVKPGVRVGVVGIGGLGHLGLQFAKALGGTVVAFSRSASKEAESRSLGADEFINYGDAEATKKASRSVDVLLVTANAENMPFDLFLSFLKTRGQLLLVGLPEDGVKFRAGVLVSRGVKFVGSHIGSTAGIKAMLKLASEKNVRAVVQKLPMSKVNEGVEMVRNGSVRYRVVLEN